MQKFIKYNFNIKFSIRRNCSIEERLPDYFYDYVFYREGGLSWSIPYIAGLYALACQFKPDITPDIFWSTALETGDIIKVLNNNNEYELKKIVNPVRLIEAIE